MHRIFLLSYEDDEVEADEEAVAAACEWESMRSMSSSSLTPHVSTTQIKQLVTGNARTLLQVTHLDAQKKIDLETAWNRNRVLTSNFLMDSHCAYY